MREFYMRTETNNGLQKLKELAQVVRTAEKELEKKFDEEDRKPSINQKKLAPFQRAYSDAVEAYATYCQQWLEVVLSNISKNLRNKDIGPFLIWARSIREMDIQGKPWYEEYRTRFERLHAIWQSNRSKRRPVLNENMWRPPASTS